jgi:NADH-quinone oxidoreductase subunit I
LRGVHDVPDDLPGPVHPHRGRRSPWDDREKYPRKFEIDELRCIYCGMCEEACPVDAIELTTEYDIVGLSRQEMVFDKEKLLHVHDLTIGKKPM